MIPSVEDCFELMEKYGMLENIKAHSIIVEKLANIIAKGLREAGADISLEKVTAGALMHDIGKTPCLDSGGNHAVIGAEICLKNHLDEISDIVGEHVRLKNYRLNKEINEKEIVYYADKRVNHDSVVSLEERLEYILIHYGRNREPLCQLIRENFNLSKDVEKKLFANLNFMPEDLAHMMEI